MGCKICQPYHIFGDIKILVKTVFAVVRREGIHSETSATMEAFKGTSKD